MCRSLGSQSSLRQLMLELIRVKRPEKVALSRRFCRPCAKSNHPTVATLVILVSNPFESRESHLYPDRQSLNAKVGA